jgi:lambda family phage portal protein
VGLWQKIRSALSAKRDLTLVGGTTFDGSRFNRQLADWVVSLMSADDELRWSVRTLRGRARDLEKNNAIARHFLRMLHVNVVGPHGIAHSSQVRNNSGKLNEAINERIETAWEDWSQNVNIEGTQGLTQFQRLALKSVARDGEAFVRLWRAYPHNDYAFALELIDPDLVDEQLNVAFDASTGTTISMGVELDQHRRAVAFHVWNKPQSTTGGGALRERVRIPASEIIHLFDPDRAGQARGVSWFIAAMVPLRHLNAYVESELVAARISSSKMGFFERAPEAWGGATAPPGGQNFQMEADPGTFSIMPDGYKLSTFDPNHPNTAFGEFVKGAMRQVGTALGVSYPSLGNDLEGVNYSSMRSGLLVERDNWRAMQDWWVTAFLKPVYREWLRMAVVSGAVTLDSRDFRKFLAVRFSPRGWPWVDPLKDMQAAVLAIENGMACRTDVLSEMGEDFEEVLEKLAEEKQMAEDLDVQITGGNTKPVAAAEPDPAAADDGDGADPEGEAEDATDSPKGESVNGGAPAPKRSSNRIWRALPSTPREPKVEVHLNVENRGATTTKTVTFVRDEKGMLREASVREAE